MLPTPPFSPLCSPRLGPRSPLSASASVASDGDLNDLSKTDFRLAQWGARLQAGTLESCERAAALERALLSTDDDVGTVEFEDFSLEEREEPPRSEKVAADAAAASTAVPSSSSSGGGDAEGREEVVRGVVWLSCPIQDEGTLEAGLNEALRRVIADSLGLEWAHADICVEVSSRSSRSLSGDSGACGFDGGLHGVVAEAGFRFEVALTDRESLERAREALQREADSADPKRLVSEVSCVFELEIRSLAVRLELACR